jgi:hypothetical protein
LEQLLNKRTEPRFLEQTREQNRDFWSKVWTREQTEISGADFGQENKVEISGADFRKENFLSKEPEALL